MAAEAGLRLPELVQLLLSTPTVDDFLNDLAGTAAAIIQPVAACGITLQRERQPITVSS